MALPFKKKSEKEKKNHFSKQKQWMLWASFTNWYIKFLDWYLFKWRPIPTMGWFFFDKGENKFYYVCPFFYIKNDLISATTTHEHYHGFHCFEVDENMFSNMRAKFLNECFFSQTEETFFYKWSPWSFHEWVKHFMEWENWN